MYNLNIIKYICNQYDFKTKFTQNEIKFILESKMINMIYWILDNNDITQINKIDIIEGLSNNLYILKKIINKYPTFFDDINNEDLKKLIEDLFVNNNSFECFDYLYKLYNMKPELKCKIEFNIDNLIKRFNNLLKEYGNFFKPIQIVSEINRKIKLFIDEEIMDDINQLVLKMNELDNHKIIEYIFDKYNNVTINTNILYSCFIEACYNNSIALAKVIFEYNNFIKYKINSFDLIKMCLESKYYNLILYLDKILLPYNITQDDYYIFKQICKNYNMNNNNNNNKNIIH